METRSKIFAIFLILCILTCISAVSASDVNDTQLGESQQTVEVTQSPDLDDNQDIVQSGGDDDSLNANENESEDIVSADENSSDDEVVGVNCEDNNETLGVNLEEEPILSANPTPRNFYMSTFKTTYNSGRTIYYGWTGYFNGYFKVFKGTQCVRSRHLSCWDGDFYWNVYGLAPGTYYAKLISNGKTYKNSRIIVAKMNSKTVVYSFTTKAGTKFTCYAYVMDRSTGAYVSGGVVTFKIAGKTYKARVRNGEAIVKFTAPSVTKTYKCYASYSGGKYVTGSKTVFRMAIQPKHRYVTVTMPTHYYYTTKWVGNVKIQTYEFATPSIKTVCIFVYRNGKMLTRGQYLSTVHYKVNGHWHWSKTAHGTPAATYHKYTAWRPITFGNVKVKVWV